MQFKLLDSLRQFLLKPLDPVRKFGNLILTKSSEFLLAETEREYAFQNLVASPLMVVTAR